MKPFEQDITTIVISHVTLHQLMLEVGAVSQVVHFRKSGDAFLAHIGAYLEEKGFKATTAWAVPHFEPLIAICEKARLRY